MEVTYTQNNQVIIEENVINRNFQKYMESVPNRIENLEQKKFDFMKLIVFNIIYLFIL